MGSKKQRGDIRYYRKQDRKTSKAYKRGRQHEYNIMYLLRKQGFHCMRRFGSKGVWFCNKCMRHVAINKKFCKTCNTDKHVVSASLDVTAFKYIKTINGTPLGVYFFITCKYSKRGTAPFDDPTWENLVKYAEYYGGIPVFAGVTSKRKPYIVDLRNMTTLPFDAFYRMKPHQKPNKKMIQRLIEEAWSLVDFCNEVVNDKKQPLKLRASFARIKATALSDLNKILYKAGLTATPDEITSLFEKTAKLAEEMEKEKERENAKQS